MYVLYVLYVGVQCVYRIYCVQHHVTFGYHSSSHGSIGSIVVRATSTNSSSSALSSCDTWLIRSVTRGVKYSNMSTAWLQAWPWTFANRRGLYGSRAAQRLSGRSAEPNTNNPRSLGYNPTTQRYRWRWTTRKNSCELSSASIFGSAVQATLKELAGGIP